MFRILNLLAQLFRLDLVFLNLGLALPQLNPPRLQTLLELFYLPRKCGELLLPADEIGLVLAQHPATDVAVVRKHLTGEGDHAVGLAAQLGKDAMRRLQILGHNESTEHLAYQGAVTVFAGDQLIRPADHPQIAQERPFAQNGPHLLPRREGDDAAPLLAQQSDAVESGIALFHHQVGGRLAQGRGDGCAMLVFDMNDIGEGAVGGKTLLLEGGQKTHPRGIILVIVDQPPHQFSLMTQNLDAAAVLGFTLLQRFKETLGLLFPPADLGEALLLFSQGIGEGGLLRTGLVQNFSQLRCPGCILLGIGFDLAETKAQTLLRRLETLSLGLLAAQLLGDTQNTILRFPSQAPLGFELDPHLLQLAVGLFILLTPGRQVLLRFEVELLSGIVLLLQLDKMGIKTLPLLA
ncbi:MAG: hypothetical protein BWY77_00134 [bacterium ADurb.Bin431]|nr:MAG: hypothetical protein BWY77_00134 [bacterium ADurb.Bin431]